ncbi:extracellular solute-binding protein [Natronospirillum operosum]|uniref:Extracellular solute-binding protein n=1 Tax=Natronospirillum operosum TaxID=2759953 RepID=A0A4Z0WC59_9GAMM|nr:extracellular solute-binding protein [Natronospirillum operosum]TGG93503.1 extracellular solute-binding protein [Natronospirillum operosum]
MKTTKSYRPLVSILALMMAGSAMANDVRLDLLTDNSPNSLAAANALVNAYMEENPGVRIEVEVRPGGSEGDNIVRSRLATGSMSDLFFYNSGSLLQALNPSRTLVDLSNEPFMDNVLPSFQSVVEANGGIYGVPAEAGMGGGILYNRDIYAELGLEVPTTWDQFMDNNTVIAEAGYAPVIGTFRDTWTSQLFVLADYFNVMQEDPDFHAEFTAGNRTFAESTPALRSFERMQSVHEAGYFNTNYDSAGYEDGLRMLVEGEGAHYPMLTFAISAIVETFGDQVDNVGFFAQPGDSPDANGLTVWMPGSLYINQDSSHIDEAKDFLAFVASTRGCEVIIDEIGASGPFLIEGCGLPDDVPQPVADMLVYFEDPERNAPALEFLSPVKGPSLEQITVEIGSGIRDARSGAELYDRDVRRQARQLGLDGWN